MACTCQSGKGLCDNCLKSVYERNSIGVIPVSNPNGEYTKAQVAAFEKAFMNNIVEDIEKSPLAEAAKKYPDFYAAVKDINSDFLNRPYIVTQLPDYPVLSKRLEKGPITPLEFAAFIKESNYTPSTAIASSNAQGSRFLREMEYYYNGDFADSVLGGFCGLFNSIFGAIDAFFDMIGTIDGFIQDVFSFLRKIKNIGNELLAAFEAIKVKALIEAIKEKVGEMVEKAIQKVCQSIANFDVGAITGPIKTPAQAQMSMKVEEEKSALSDICGEENAKRIKEKIQGLIDYATGLFTNPSLEEIVALISRICAMATGIEGLFKQLKDPLNNFADRYNEVFNTLSNASNRVTGEAIRGGAIRPTDSFREELINRARIVWEKAGNIKPPTVEELKNMPSWEKIKDNTHDKIRIEGGWVTKMKPAHEGWTRIEPVTRILLLRLQEKAKKKELIKGPLKLVSGFRNQQYNKDVGGAKQSQHMAGNAVDIKWDGFKPNDENLEIFVRTAKRLGFRGVGYYDTFVHLDIGPDRYWDERSASKATRQSQPVTTPVPKTAASTPETPAQVPPASDYGKSGSFVDGMYHLFGKYDGIAEFDYLEASDAAKNYAPAGTVYSVTYVDSYGSSRLDTYRVIQSKRLSTLRSMVRMNDPEEVERYRKQEFDV